ncbi:macroglobulin / complement [Anaeramoeba flamelloides]|uniref:Macroglobulin / complement n=1 Tax=Anaeramoeba flamelloides TaxID=1746091 RepID=A0AAV7ZGM2_9EUKA|nr:macroglobulin / complement [Anaeramoeba flamelloides]
MSLNSKKRYTVYLTTDKQNYNPGEVVMGRGILLDSFTHRPLQDKIYNTSWKHTHMGYVKILSPDESVLLDKKINASHSNSVYSFSYKLSPDQIGGEYTVIFYHKVQGITLGIRKFSVHKFEKRMFKVDLNFACQGYGPGDKVNGHAIIERLEGGIPVKAKVAGHALVDGLVVWSEDGLKIEKKTGKVKFEFRLPKKITKGKGTINLNIEEGGAQGNSSKTIPIVLQTLDIEFYPEGGDVIAGLQNSVYFECLNPVTGEPADFSGVLYENEKSLNIPLRTIHEGRGRFDFSARENKDYTIKFSYPKGLQPIKFKSVFRLKGCTIRLLSKQSVKFGGKIQLEINSTTELTNAYVYLCKREIVLCCCHIKEWEKRKDQTFCYPLTYNPYPHDGVIRVTVMDCELNVPLSERLLFVEPREEIRLKVTSDQKSYSPGDRVKLNIQATGINGCTKPAFVCTTVTDDPVYKMDEKRKRFPRLPEMVFLENEVKELNDPRSYLYPDFLQAENEESKSEGAVGEETENNNLGDPKQYVDLLLGTQGWRRFCYKDVESFIQKNLDNQEQIKRLLAYENNKDQSLYSFSDSPLEKSGLKKKLSNQENLQNNVTLEKNPIMEKVTKQKEKKKKKREREMMKINKRKMHMKKKKKKKKTKKKDENKNKYKEKKKNKRKRRVTRSKKKRSYSSSTFSDDSWEESELELDEGKLGFYEENMNCKKNQRIKFLRVYSHRRRLDWEPDQRRDFANTLFFDNCRKTSLDLKTGEFQTEIEFELNDSITSFRVFVDAFDLDGNVGCNQNYVFHCKKIFYVEPRLPNEVSFGDSLQIPINVVNNYPNKLKEIELLFETKGQAMKLMKKNYWKGAMLGKKREGKYFKMRIENITKPSRKDKKENPDSKIQNILEQENKLVFTGIVRDTSKTDQIIKPLNIKPPGFPLEYNFSGTLGPNSHTDLYCLQLPSDCTDGFFTTEITFHPSSLSNLNSSLKSLIREPHGCFEQISSTCWPMVMAMQYLVSNDVDDDQLIQRGKRLIARATKKLLAYRVKSDNGFSIFGGKPSSIIMTSWGLIEFMEIQKVSPIIPTSDFEKTIKYILSRADNRSGTFKGGYRKEATVLQQLFILWSLSNYGVDPELVQLQYQRSFDLIAKGKKHHNKKEHLKDVGAYQRDPYILALMVLVSKNFGYDKDANVVCNMLLDYYNQKWKSTVTTDGIRGAKKSIVYSRNKTLTIETTALCALAWMKCGQVEPVEGCVNYIHKNSKRNRYGTTLSTVLALKAILEWENFCSSKQAVSKIDIFSNNDLIESVTIEKEQKDCVILKNISACYKIGKKNTVSFQMHDGKPMPFNFYLQARTKSNVSNQNCQISLTTRALGYNTSEFQMFQGEIIQLQIDAQNTGTVDEPSGMVVAIIGIPGGCSIRLDQLKQLKKKKLISFFELLGAREVVFYWENMDAQQRVSFSIDLIAECVGTFNAPHSRAYLYYDDDKKCWSDGLILTILNKDRLSKGGYDLLNKEQIAKFKRNYTLLTSSDKKKDPNLGGQLQFPSQLSVHVCKELINIISHDEIQYRGSDDDEFIIRSQLPIPRSAVQYYFEMTILNPGRKKYLAIGLVPEEHDLTGMPGWVNSIGYHADDGSIFVCSGEPTQECVKYLTNDVVGLGWDKFKQHFYFTKNGSLQCAISQQELMKKTLYPAIGLSCKNIHVIINFGQDEFLFKKANILRQFQSKN